MYLVLFSGFRGTHCPPALPSDALGDNMPDVHDEADFEIPYTQSSVGEIHVEYVHAG